MLVLVADTFHEEERAVGPVRHCPPRHPTHVEASLLESKAPYDVASNICQAQRVVNPGFSSKMASYDVASNVCRAIARGTVEDAAAAATVRRVPGGLRRAERLAMHHVRHRVVVFCRMPCRRAARPPGRGVIEKKHSTYVESPPPRVCMSVHPEGVSYGHLRFALDSLYSRTSTRPTLNLLLLLRVGMVCVSVHLESEACGLVRSGVE